VSQQVWYDKDSSLLKDIGLNCEALHPKERPIQLPLKTHEWMWRIYSNLDPQGSPISQLLRHTSGCGGSIVTGILTGPLSVTFYDTRVDVEDLF
jgi:hypothetical protein